NPCYQFLRRHVLENMKPSLGLYACLILAIVPLAVFQLVQSSQPCAAEGSYEIVDGTCQNYYMCIFNGVILQPYNLTCASPSLFDPTAGLCMTGYVCEQPVTDNPSQCTTNGRFLIPGTGCKSYRFCYIYPGAVINRTLTCPNSLIFNPGTQKCVLNSTYTCVSP
ncbi:uncharacterized protein LOC144467706, partial [Augochlora pura]